MTISDEYLQELLRLRDDVQWGISGGAISGETVVSFLKDNPHIKTILDYGCGEVLLKKYVEEHGITDREWTLYDPAMAEFNIRPTGTFNMVITTDVLEHVEPHMIRKVIQELYDYSDNILFNDIACYYTYNHFLDGPYIGQDFHINIEAPDVWRKLFSHLNIETLVSKPYIIREWQVRYLSILKK